MTKKKNITVLEYLRSTKKLGTKGAAKVCDKWGITYTTKMESITEDKLEVIEKQAQEDPQQKQQVNIARLITIGSLRGMRLKQGLPARGQRTRSNAKTAKRLNAQRSK